MGRQAVRRLPERGWPGRLTALEEGQPQSYLGRQYRKICQTPEKKRLGGSPDPGKKNIWLACPSGTAASSQAAQLGNLAAVCQEAGNRTLTDVRSMRLVRHQPSDRQASRQSSQALPDSQLTLVAIFSVAFDAKPRNNI